jgi:RNA polymerase-binding transcription factor
MPKKKPTKTEARPRKKKEQRTPVSKGVASPRGASARRGTREAPSPKTAGGSASRGSSVAGKSVAAKTAAAGRSREEKSPKPLAKVKAGPRDAAAVVKGPQKPAKPTRRIPNAELNKIRNLLAQKKIALTNHLQSELSELEKPEKRHRTDLEEIASDTHDTDSLCEIMDIEASQIGQIDMALTKIDNGTYGICEDCGGEIPLIRLEALPFATQCIECKRKAEIEGRISAER